MYDENYTIEVLPENDPVEIAMREFGGDKSSRSCWRKYFHALIDKTGSIDEASQIFCDCILTAKSEIKHDHIPDESPARGCYPEQRHIHAKLFTNIMKRFVPRGR